MGCLCSDTPTPPLGKPLCHPPWATPHLTGGSSTSTDSKQDAVLVAIENSHTLLKQQIDTVVADLILLRGDHVNLTGKGCAAEQTISVLQPKMSETEKGLQALRELLRVLEERANDEEEQSHMNNIHVGGLPKTLEGSDPVHTGRMGCAASSLHSTVSFLHSCMGPQGAHTTSTSRSKSTTHGDTPVALS
ncbi:hypothetical protein NDU88_008932 [Pleurodeles waltl]|uniref:Uncharacterized protein n=1 Tax=Pleurodeles waltl TaxID=8319 RepID=A0AAV7RZ30_PLEWA|nr:hypothetical protein NDU88_008932 [Pleurodeles waltl]